MDEIKLEPILIKNGVLFLSEIRNEFESAYLKVREKEKRIYSDVELLNLPFASEKNPHRTEWLLRAKSFLRFKNYLKSEKGEANIIDLGCGNGWFCGQLSKSLNHNFFCVDVNLTELVQGRRALNSGKLRFIYADIFKTKFPEKCFDYILINAAIQYFPDLSKLLKELLTPINENGEIHIIDSAIYSVDEAIKAKERTKNYYSSLGFPEMADNYFHHTWNELSEFNFEILYQPNSFSGKIKRLFLKADSPFPWIKITR